VVFFFFLVKVSMVIYLQLCYSGLFHQVSIQIGGMVILFFGYLHVAKLLFFFFWCRHLLRTRAAEKTLKLGTLEDLAKARRGVLDPSGTGSNVIPGDVLWSDPSLNNGLSPNQLRGIGLLFGPDCTQEFLEKHKLKVQNPQKCGTSWSLSVSWSVAFSPTEKCE